jgi:hypothetical protein
MKTHVKGDRFVDLTYTRLGVAFDAETIKDSIDQNFHMSETRERDED